MSEATVMTKKTIYLDNSASTPVDPEVMKAMFFTMRDVYGDSSSGHKLGKRAKRYLEESREKIAKFVGCDSTDVIFTSGGTEANNLAIKGIALKEISQGKMPHLITAKTEHLSVLNAFKQLRDLGCGVTYVEVDNKGYVVKQSLKKVIKKNTLLISLMHSNNLTGTIQNIEEVVPSTNIYAHKSKFSGIYFHSDVVHTIARLEEWAGMLYGVGVDMLSLSAHKIYGPKGVGALIVKDKCKLLPLFNGEENGRVRRAGTENLPGIVGFATAIEILAKRGSEDIENIRRLEKLLIDELDKNKIRYYINGDPENHLPGVLNLTFDGITDGESLMNLLDLVDVYVSAVSSGSSGDKNQSYVLESMGIDENRIKGAIRISIGRFNTKEDILGFVDKVQQIVSRLRKA